MQEYWTLQWSGIILACQQSYLDECFFNAVGILVLNIVVSIVCQISKTSFRSLTKAPLVDDLLFKKGNVCKLTPYIDK